MADINDQNESTNNEGKKTEQNTSNFLAENQQNHSKIPEVEVQQSTTSEATTTESASLSETTSSTESETTPQEVAQKVDQKHISPSAEPTNVPKNSAPPLSETPANQQQATPQPSSAPQTSSTSQIPATPQPSATPQTSLPPQIQQQQNVLYKTNQEQTSSSSDHLIKINRELKEKETLKIAIEKGIPYINIALTPINPDLLHLIPEEDAKKALVLPFYRIGKKLRVAIANTESIKTKEILEKLKESGYEINVNLATDDGILEAMQAYKSEQYKVKSEIDTTIDEEKIKEYIKEIKNLKELETKIKTINSEEANYLINSGAYKTGASDIHYEPNENYVRIRFRIDGVLHDIFRIDRNTFVNIANQIKYKCKMKLNIANEPQDGRYSFTVNEKKVDVRVSALPTEYGETFVSRLLDSTRQFKDFEDAGFSGSALAHVKNTLNLKNGMVLITGPTGSGKTSTLYTYLEKFNKPEAKIITLEDPIEYYIEGVSQSPVNEKRGYDFANGLRAILRQDPDVVMIGEIRDFETAETATQAALTGHILLSTMHTNSAIEAISRLINIGLAPFMVAPALDTVIGQRLVRKFCPNCTSLKTVAKSKRDELERVLGIIKKVQPSLKIEIPEKLPLGEGCEVCNGTGYKGRVALVEVLDIDNEIKGLILEKSSSIKIMESARRKGMLIMYEDGILKVINGVTSLTEVRRATTMSI